MSVYTYLSRVAGGPTTKIFNALNAFLFALISAAMITVSATGFRLILNFEAQEQAYPTSFAFVLLALGFGAVAVLVAAFGFNALAEFASTCAPWLVVMFAAGGLAMLPAVAETATGSTVVSGWSEFVDIGADSIFTGQTPEGEAGISLIGIIGFAWAANSFAHTGLIDMSLLRYARKSWIGYMTSTGMFLGHYMAWIAAGLMGAAAATITSTSIEVIEPGQVAFEALGVTGLGVVVVAGWTTANANLYRSGLAAQGVFPSFSRRQATLAIGLIVLAGSAFPFIYRNYLLFVTYAGITLVPIGGILFASYWLAPRLGLTPAWARYRGVSNTPALLTWGLSVAAAGLTVGFGIMPTYIAFVPTFLLSVVLYVVLVRLSPATEDYSEGEADDEEFYERVEAFHAEQTTPLPDGVDTKDRRSLTQLLRVVWMVDLAVIFAVSVWVLVTAPDMATYEDHRSDFWWVVAVGTLIYFACAYTELRRKKAYAKRVRAEHEPEPDPADVASVKVS